MPRVVPGQIVDFLNRTLSGSSLKSVEISTVLDLVSELSPELLIISGNDYSSYRVSINAISDLIHAWKVGKGNQPKEMEAKKALGTLQDLLSKCPDEIPSPSTTELLFIADVALRDSIRNDISAANRAFVDGLWKAATVLAGAASEALLLWAITSKKTPTEVETVRQAVIPSTHQNPHRWDLDGYVKVSRQLALIDVETQKQVDLAREFRNLIHPGRAARLAKVCDRGTALSALASVELIVRDLS